MRLRNIALIVIGAAAGALLAAISLTNQNSQSAATVDGQPIYLAEVDSEAGSELRDLLCGTYALRVAALNQVIDRRVLQREAARRATTVMQLLGREVLQYIGHSTRGKQPRNSEFATDRSSTSAFTIEDAAAFHARLRRYLDQVRGAHDVAIRLAPDAGVSCRSDRTLG